MRATIAGLLERYFYLGMSLLIAAVVVYGFGQTVDHKLVHAAVRRPVLVWVHAAVFSAWVVLLIVQSGLVQNGNVRLHRRLGWFGLGLGCCVAGLGMWTAVVMRAFDLEHGGELAASAPNLTIAGLDIASFTVPFALGILLRRNKEAHRRLMLVATIGLCSAAFVRFPAPLGWPWYYAGTDALVLLGVLRDLAVTRRVHTVYAVALPAMMVAQLLVMKVDLHYWP
jgi:hypothetical protein